MNTPVTVAPDRAARLEEAIGRLRLRRPPAERVERWLLMAGAALGPIGVVLLVSGWWGAARSPFVVDQIPYVISGGLMGLACCVAGALLFFGYWLTRLVREGREQAADQHALLTEIRDLLREGAAPPRRPLRRGAPARSEAE